MRRVVFTAAILACVLGLAACGDDSGDSGDDKGSIGLGSQSPSATKGSGKTGTPLAGTDPCVLLKPADVPELNQESGFTPKANRGTCSGFDFAVAIKDVTPAAYDMTFDGSTVTALPDIAGRRAAMSETNVAGLKSCHVTLEVTRNELVTVTVTHSKEPSKSCDIAKKAATVVAGRLPV